MSAPRVFLLGGSLGRPSHTSALLQAAERTLWRQGGRTERWDLAERPLPLADPGQHGLPVALREEPERSLVRAADQAHAVVIASPLYHNSYSGAVKNALDHLSAAQFALKPVALLSHSGVRCSTQALDHLRLVVRGLSGIALPAQVITLDSDWTRDGHGFTLVSPAIEARLAETASELLWLVASLRAAPRGAGSRRDSTTVVAGTT